MRGVLRRLLLLGCMLAVRPAYADVVKPDEPLVMRLIFEECLGFIRDGRVPFAGLATQPASSQARDEFPSGMPNRDQIVELLSPRYAAAWGSDGSASHCMVRTVLDPALPNVPGLLGVDPVGFIGRVAKRAGAVGLTEHSPEPDLSPLVVPYWSEPETGQDAGPRRPVRIAVMPGGANDARTLLDVGIIIVSGPPRVGH